jgi:hypothetical protein
MFRTGVLPLEQAQAFGKLVKKIGLRRFLILVAFVCWFLIPFLIWYQLYLWIGQNFLLFDWAFLGVVVILAFTMVIAYWRVKLILFREKMVKHVEHAKQMFADPANPTSEENFRRECGKFIVPYLHFPHVFVLGFANMIRKGRLAKKIGLRVFQLFLHFFISYLFVVFLISIQSNLNRASTLFVSALTYFPSINNIFVILLHNLILVIIASAFVSSCFSIEANREVVPFPNYVFDVFYDYFSIFNRLVILGATLISSPWEIRENMSTLTYSPFTFQPTTVTEIIQKAVDNIEQTECQVTVWKHEVKSASDVIDLKNMISETVAMPSNVKSFCLAASDEEILKTINNSRPILYLGIIDKRCSIVGRVIYDKTVRIYRGTFTFDNKYVKNMFKSIADIQIKTQEKLSSKLPDRVNELVKQLKVCDDEQARD